MRGVYQGGNNYALLFYFCHISSVAIFLKKLESSPNYLTKHNLQIDVVRRFSTTYHISMEESKKIFSRKGFKLKKGFKGLKDVVLTEI